MLHRYATFIKFILCGLLICATASWGMNVQQPQIRNYIRNLSKHYDFNEAQLNQWFREATFDQRVIAKMTAPPGEVIPWYDYRNLFITSDRIAQGVRFYRQHAASFAQAKHNFGVSPAVIVGILGVETSYGVNEGKFSAFDTLSTLAFHYPPRHKFFTDELTQFLLLSREQQWNPLSIKSSYAGAIGMPQFMPSSYRRYAIDASGGRNGDLFHNSADVIASVANYLDKKGWRAGQPVALPAQVLNEKYQALKNQDGQLRFTIGKLRKYGIIPPTKLPAGLPAGILFMQGEQGLEPWITFANFQVIKRYNTSNRYALVVYELGKIIENKAQS